MSRRFVNGKKRLIVLGARVDNKIAYRVALEAKKRGISVSDLVQEALIDFLNPYVSDEEWEDEKRYYAETEAAIAKTVQLSPNDPVFITMKFGKSDFRKESGK